MSTILKTLKKLEEEKSFLDQKTDLKSLVLQENVHSASSFSMERSRWILLFGALILGGGVLAGMWIFFSSPSPGGAQIPLVAVHEPPPAASAVKEFMARAESHPGIPLVQIPEPEELSRLVGDAEMSQPVADDDTTQQVSLNSEPVVPQEADDPISVPEMEAIDMLIKNATAAALEDTGPSLPASAADGARIPGLEVKGIIFLFENSPSNHVLVTTRGKGSSRLSVGDHVQEAMVKEILPNEVVFSYQGQLVKMGIGR